MKSSISFVLDGRVVGLDFNDPAGPHPTTTVLNYLRSLPLHKGVKEGCAEGDCGACTVVVGEMRNKSIRYKSIDSCLVFLPMLHGKQLITVENLKSHNGELHPVQQAMVETGGSQCGYCTPGIIMSLFSLYKNSVNPSRAEIDDVLTGNLCRCTGYKPIIEAAAKSSVRNGMDHFVSDQSRIVKLLQSFPKDSIRIQTKQQHYFCPASLGEAVTLKHQHPESIIVCGATDVALRVTKKHELLKEIIDISDVAELKGVEDKDSIIVLGSGVFLSDLMSTTQKYFPALYDMLTVFGSQQIRNLATLGGNLGTASPIGDTLPVLMAYNARVVLESVNGRREVSLDDYFTGYRTTVRKANEIITSVIIPKLSNRIHVKSYKVSRRKDLDIATVSGGFRLELHHGSVKDIKLVYGGMAERVKRAATAEQFLTGKHWNRETVEEAMPLIDKDFTPISDARSGAEFRRVVARNTLLKFWSETNGRAS
jgi:xanthine dehydrogenase small subunit